MGRNIFWTASDAALRQSLVSWRIPITQLQFDRLTDDGSPEAAAVLLPLNSTISVQTVAVNLPAGATIPLILVALGTYTPSLALYDSAGYLLNTTSADLLEQSGQDTITNFTVPQSGTYYFSVAWKYVQGATGTFGIILNLPKGSSSPKSLIGYAENDWLRGESGAETLLGLAGNDVLYGNGGADVADGDAGNDTIYGGDGADTVRGLDDNDLIFGQADNDDLNGNRGNDTVYGDAGADLVRGGQENDLVYGGDGNDPHVNGNVGNDTVYGGDGNDGVFGGQDNDVLYGDAGNDTLSGDLGNDTLTGGAGADQYLFRPGGGADQDQRLQPRRRRPHRPAHWHHLHHRAGVRRRTGPDTRRRRHHQCVGLRAGSLHHGHDRLRLGSVLIKLAERSGA